MEEVMSLPLKTAFCITWYLSSTKPSFFIAKWKPLFDPWDSKSATTCKADCSKEAPSHLLLPFVPSIRPFHWVVDRFNFIPVSWVLCYTSVFEYLERLKNSGQYHSALSPQNRTCCFYNNSQNVGVLFWVSWWQRGRWDGTFELLCLCAAFKCPASSGQSVAWLKTPWVC